MLCRVAGLHFALGLEHVVETMRPQPLEPLGDLPPAAGGSATVRGQTVPVLILGRWFAKTESQPQRLVMARTGEVRVGLAVDAVIGVRSFDAGDFDRPACDVCGAAR